MGVSIPRKWRARLVDVLEPDEDIEMAMAEHKLGSPRPFAKAVLFATNKRLIITRRSVFGTYSTYRIIHYDEIVQIIVHRGLHYCRVHFGLRAEAVEKEEWKRWTWGLDKRETDQLLHFMEQKRSAIQERKV